MNIFNKKYLIQLHVSFLFRVRRRRAHIKRYVFEEKGLAATKRVYRVIHHAVKCVMVAKVSISPNWHVE